MIIVISEVVELKTLPTVLTPTPIKLYYFKNILFLFLTLWIHGRPVLYILHYNR